MKISELIAAIGDDKVQLQNLDHCAIDLDWSQKKGTTIKFGTEVRIVPFEGTEKLGLILWFDRDAVAAFMAKTKAEPTL